MRFIVFPLFAVLFLSTSALAVCRQDSTKTPSPDTVLTATGKFDPTADPAKDLQKAIVEATKTHKRILLDVGGEWCIWCRRLDSLFDEHSDIAKLRADHFVVVKINVSKENENEKFLSQYPKVPGYPHIFVLDNGGKLLHSQDTGKLEKGRHHDPEKVRAFLTQWAAPGSENPEK